LASAYRWIAYASTSTFFSKPIKWWSSSSASVRNLEKNWRVFSSGLIGFCLINLMIMAAPSWCISTMSGTVHPKSSFWLYVMFIAQHAQIDILFVAPFALWIILHNLLESKVYLKPKLIWLVRQLKNICSDHLNCFLPKNFRAISLGAIPFDPSTRQQYALFLST